MPGQRELGMSPALLSLPLMRRPSKERSGLLRRFSFFRQHHCRRLGRFALFGLALLLALAPLDLGLDRFGLRMI